MAQVLCLRDGGLDLGSDVVLAYGVNDVDDAFWSAWLAKYTGSHLVDDGIVSEVKVLSLMPDSDPITDPAEPETTTEQVV